MGAGRSGVRAREFEQFRDEERTSRFKAVKMEVASPGSEVLPERPVRRRIPTVQPAAIAPQRGVVKEPLQQVDCHHAVAFPHVRIRFQLREMVREPLREIAGARIPVRDAHRVGGKVGGEGGRLRDALRGIVGPRRREAVENEERGNLAQRLVEPPVLVVPVAIEVGQDVAQLVRELGHVVAPVGVSPAEPHLVGSLVVEHLRVPAPRRYVDGRVRISSECGQQNVGRGGEHAADRPEAGCAPVAVFDRQEGRALVPHHSVPLS